MPDSSINYWSDNQSNCLYVFLWLFCLRDDAVRHYLTHRSSHAYLVGEHNRLYNSEQD